MAIRVARTAILIISIFILPGLVWFSAGVGTGYMRVPTFALALGISFAACVLLTPVARRLALILNVVDIPGGRKIHRRPTPLLGGVAVFVSLLIPMVVLGGFSFPRNPILLGAAIILAVGIADDAVGNVPAKIRILLQVGAAAIVMHYGAFFMLLPGIPGTVIGIPLTLFWIVGITNAVNFLDGMDGLASGLCAAAAGGLCAAAHLSGMESLSVMSAAVCGASLGFIVHNFNPAVIFLGDAGATTLGFLIASIGASGVWTSDNRLHSFIVPVIALAIPIFDMTFTTVERFGSGKVRTITEWMVFTGRDHFHHRISGLGFGVRGTVAIIYVIGIALAALACLASVISFYASIIVFTLITAFFITIAFYMASRSGKAVGDGS